jgi:hypothetical protein
MPIRSRNCGTRPIACTARVAMRFALIACAMASACGGKQFRTEPVGMGTGLVTARTAPGTALPTSAAPGAGGIQLPRGTYEIKVWFDLPRAQLVDWQLACPGIALTGTAGETIEDYRERRIAELRAQRDSDREKVAFLTDVLVGDRAKARVETPHVAVSADAAVGDNVARAVISDDVYLAPHDTGRGTISTQIPTITTTDDGVCAILASADDSTVTARFHVTRIRDLAAEARDRRAEQARGAILVRTRLETRLVGFGADASARTRRLEAEARARAVAESERHARDQLAAYEARVRAEREAQVRIELAARREAELRAKLELEARVKLERERPARQVRELYVWYLTGKCNADPDRRERIAEERRAEARIRADREAAVRLRLEAQRAETLRIRAERDGAIRARLDAEQAERDRIAAAADAELARERERMRIARARARTEASRVRADVSAYLVRLGAVVRPPMPEPIPEDSGTAPSDGFAWTAGHWRWQGLRWIWIGGAWSDPTMFGTAGGGVTIEVGPPIHRDPVIRDHRPPPRDTPVIRDHRPLPPRDTPVIRDHRPARDRPVVRDHRKSDDDDKKKVIRDHRRR